MTAPRPSDERNVSSSDTTNASRRGFITTALATGSALAFGGTAIAAESSSSASVTFDDQTTDGETVTTASVTLPEGGFVAVHDERLLDGKALESVVGVSDYLDAGTHEDLSVSLFEGVPGREFEMASLQGEATLIAMPHFDTDDDGTYDFVTSQGEADGPYTKDGKPVVDDACITVPGKC